MKVRALLEATLRAGAYDGLCNPNVPCGCLLGELAPCGGGCLDCVPGKRRDYKPADKCGCDMQGEEHWHVEEPTAAKLHPGNWHCMECGEVADPCSSAWRWNGNDWEHWHGYPVGHVLAVTKDSPYFKINATPVVAKYVVDWSGPNGMQSAGAANGEQLLELFENAQRAGAAVIMTKVVNT